MLCKLHSSHSPHLHFYSKLLFPKDVKIYGRFDECACLYFYLTGKCPFLLPPTSSSKCHLCEEAFFESKKQRLVLSYVSIRLCIILFYNYSFMYFILPTNRAISGTESCHIQLAYIMGSENISQNK